MGADAPNKNMKLTAEQKAQVETLADNRDTAVRAIREALKRRSGKYWSVTGGKGTAWGWIKISAPPGRCTGQWRLKPLCVVDRPENYEWYDSGQPGRSMTPADGSELGKLMGHDRPVSDYVSVAASTAHRRVAVCEALFGHSGGYTAEPYLD